MREYLRLAVHVMRVCRGQLGNVDALTYVSRSVGRAAISSARAFVRGFRDLDKMGLCPICQDGFELGRYGVLVCGYIMHLDCRVPYEAYERGRSPHRLPE